MSLLASMTRLAILASAVMLAGCATGPPPPPLIGQADVTAALKDNSLESLYARIQSELDSGQRKPEEVKSLTALKTEVADKLADRLAQQIQNDLNAATRVAGVLPLSVLDAQRKRAQAIQEWSPAVYQRVDSELNQDLSATQSAIAERKAQLTSIAPEEVEQRLALLDELAGLSGAGTPAAAEFEKESGNLIGQLDSEATEAMAAENYDEAQRLLEKVQEVRPDDTQTAERLATVSTKVFERDFYHALENGDPDRGYDLLIQVAASPSFPLILPNLSPSKDAMAKYYITRGQAQTQKGNIPEAYRRFEQARKIQALLGDGTNTPPSQEAAFRTLLEKEFQRSIAANQPGLAWGYLKVIESMNPADPNLRRQLRETRELVIQRATKRLSVSSFETPDDTDEEFGDAVSASIVQHLFVVIPNDVRIIEREQLSDIIREHSLQGENAGKSKLASADYLVQGTILEAKVDTIEKRGKKTMRVVTEQVEEPNPAHEKWLNLSGRKRDDTPEPPKNIMVPRKEDVTVEVTVHRKIGIFSVSYRVIDTETAKVTFADSARSVAKHEDTSSEGMELGEFKLEF
ncbi:MAG: hypothetical protein VX252_06955, partial [Myxococcota bacterium]|nr:hypothetical protein [Myxococcota bacterium]